MQQRRATVRGTKAERHLLHQLGLQLFIHSFIDKYLQDTSYGSQAKSRRETTRQGPAHGGLPVSQGD